MRGAFGRLRRMGVLGINSRNADYIMSVNKRSSFPVVDDKVTTKRVAERFNVPTPPIYRIVERHGDLPGLRDSLSPLERFVVKPARGSGGSGILLVAGHTREGLTSHSGEFLSWDDLTYHVSDILSGIYSLSGLEDRALIEALVEPSPDFSGVSYGGVPDVRIVVYRGCPVMGMVRLPTKSSDGKANLHRGAIGAGIDIGSGRTMSAVQGTRVIMNHPDTGRPIAGLTVPFWGEMLLIAAAALEMTGLGYVGVDLVVDRERGPLLLEMNARPGLSIQIANLSGLRFRFDKVDSLHTPMLMKREARVAWAMQAFAGRAEGP